MKTLRQSLIDYELALLHAIAACRAIPRPAPHKMEAINQLVEALLSPANTAIVLDDLAPAEVAALQFLLAQGGQVESARFARQFGAIRPIGAARLERERPWQTPANPAEGLWYRGLIFNAFEVTGQGSQQITYLPTDMLPLLAQAMPQPAPPPAFQLNPVAPPAVEIAQPHRLRENMFSLLVYLQLHPVRVLPNLAAKDKQQLLTCLLPPELSGQSLEAELDFLRHLGQRAQLFAVAHGRLRPNRDAVKSWLQAEAGPQLLALQNTWRADPTWNDLWHVPGLTPQPTGWENSPLLARSKILGYLEQLASAPAAWYSIDDFVAAIKRADPDFQRPTGDYNSWYIQDAQGKSLLGFEHWEQVEGGLIRYLLTGLLPLLAVVELGAAAAPASFRLTAAGQAFLTEQPLPPPDNRQPVYLRLDDKFRVRVPAQASLYDRFQLARIATLEQRENGRAVYLITRDSIGRALKNGVTPDQITAFLTRATNNQTPLKVVETLRAWGTRFGTVKLEQATLLRFSDSRQVNDLCQHPALRPLLGEVLGPTTILVPAANAPKVRQILIELGYLE